MDAILLSNGGMFAFQQFGKGYSCREKGVYSNVDNLRMEAHNLGVANPKYGLYLGFSLDNTTDYCFQQDPVYIANKANWFITLPGDKKPRFNLEIPAAAQWLANAVATDISTDNLDFVIFDGAHNVPQENPPDPWGTAKAAFFEMVRAALPSNVDICINGDVSNLQGAGLAPSVNCVMTEFYGLTGYDAQGNPHPHSPDDNLAALQANYTAAAAGVKTWLKTWPGGYSFLAPGYNDITAQQYMTNEAYQTFAVASYLLAENPGNSYLFYSTGYNICGIEECTGTDYPYGAIVNPYLVLNQTYGIPVGPMTCTGYVCTRQFTSGTVSVDLTNGINTGTLP
jgi:hypothetical protein